MKNNQEKPKISRRQFFGIAWFGALIVLGGQMLAALLNFIKPVPTSGFGGEIYVGKVDEFAIPSLTHVLSGRFYLFRNELGFLALWHRCTHLGCTVPWVDEEDQYHCPCHGSLFNTVGEVLGGPAPRPLDLFPITIRQGEVWVDTSMPMERNKFEPSQITGA